MKKYLAIAAAAAGIFASPVCAAVTYTFATNEPFAGGTLAFSYDAPAFVSNTGFIERSALTNVTGDIQRIRFEADCPFGGGATACDQITVIAGSTSVLRYFQDGAFALPGTYNASRGAAATLTVASGAAAVPEPASWAMLIAGIGVMGGALRRRPTVRFA